MLLKHFLAKHASELGREVALVSDKEMDLLKTYDWPGNVRELQNVIERAVVLCDSETFSIDESWLKVATHSPSKPMARPVRTLAEGEIELIEAALTASQGRVFGPSGAAAMLAIPRQTLESKIKALHIDKLSFRPR